MAYVECIDRSVCGWVEELKGHRSRLVFPMDVDFQVVSTFSKDMHSLWEGGVEEVMVLKCVYGHEGDRTAWCRLPWWRHIVLSDEFDGPY